MNDSLRAGMQHGMHAMAQPLTLLQSRLYLASSAQLDEVESRQLVADATNDVDRLAMLFRLMQQLIEVQGTAARVQDIPCSSWMDCLALDAEAVFAGAQLIFDLRTPPLLPYVRVDVDRTRQAILGLLSVACFVSTPGCTVVCTVRGRGCGVEFRLTHSANSQTVEKQKHDPFLDDVSRLRLALAEASSLSQQGSLRFHLCPLSLLLTLPVAEAAG